LAQQTDMLGVWGQIGQRNRRESRHSQYEPAELELNIKLALALKICE
jgi:hypothetical protein